jgi:hypothetical protein
MTRTIEEIRLDVLRLAVTSRPEAEALDWAAQAMHLVEHGPTIEEDADQADGAPVAVWRADQGLFMGGGTDEPPSLPEPEPPRKTVAQAIKAGREDVYVPTRSTESPITATSPMTAGDKPANEALAEAIAAVNRVPCEVPTGPRWSDARKQAMHTLMADHAAPFYGVPWADIAAKLSELPGPTISVTQARDWWAKVGAFHRARDATARQHASAAMPEGWPTKEPATAPAQPARGEPFRMAPGVPVDIGPGAGTPITHPR